MTQCPKTIKVAIEFIIGLNQTGHMSFLTRQDQTSKFAERVLPDRTKPKHTFQTFFIKIHQIETALLKKSYKSPVSGKENVWFPDVSDFANFLDFWTRALIHYI